MYLFQLLHNYVPAVPSEDFGASSDEDERNKIKADNAKKSKKRHTTEKQSEGGVLIFHCHIWHMYI